MKIILVAAFGLLFPLMPSPVAAQDATASPPVAAAPAPTAETAPVTAPAAAPVAAPAPAPADVGPVIKNVPMPERAYTPPPQKPENKVLAFFNRLFSKFSGKVSDPDPSDTMIATFERDAPPVDDKAAEQFLSMESQSSATPLDQPHRSASDLAAWLQQAIPETMSFSAESYKAHLALLGRGFSAAALSEYNTWVTATGIMSALESNNMQMNGFVTDTPFLLNEGVVAGRYRWLYEIPVMISFVPKGTNSYRGQNEVDTRRMIITLQLGRVTQSALPDNVMIETWTVRDNLRKN